MRPVHPHSTGCRTPGPARGSVVEYEIDTDAGISGLGFIFPDYDAVWKAMDAELGAFVRAQMPKAGLVAMPKIWDNGFRHVTTSNRPIHGAAGFDRMDPAGNGAGAGLENGLCHTSGIQFENSASPPPLAGCVSTHVSHATRG